LILGIGTDLVNIDRIQIVLERHGDRFRNRVFSKIEQTKANFQKNEAGAYAKRWAAKEACAKALGTGLRMGISWRDMALTNILSGKPTLSVSGWAEVHLQKLTPKGHNAIIHVSLTDDHPWAQAFVIIESIPCT